MSPERPIQGRAAIVNAMDGRVVSHRALEDRSVDLARLFGSFGLRSRSRVAILMENRTDYLVVALAAQRMGLHYTPVNWHLTPDEVAYIVADCDAEVLITSAQLEQSAIAIRDGLDRDLRVLSMDEGRALASVSRAIAEMPDVSPEPPAIEGYYVFYSSGTTGRPKGIVIEQPEKPFGTGLVIDAFLESRYGFGSDTVYYSPGPLYHAAPLGWSLATVRMGGTAVLSTKFDAEQALAFIHRYEVTHLQLTPTMMVRVMKLAPEVRELYDLGSVRALVHAGAACPPDVKRAFIDWLGPVVYEYYSGTEGAGMTTIDSVDWLAHVGSVGRAVSGELHILDDDGTELGTDEIGRIFFEGSSKFSYNNSPAKTSESYSAQGYATMGDLGSVDADGYLYLADRRTDLIISGGVNIYPREVEDVLIGHPGVTDVAVIGLPDPEWGHRVCAVVQLAQKDVTEDQLLRYCRERLAHFKCPRTFVFMAELPRLPSGKVRKAAIRDLVLGNS